MKGVTEYMETVSSLYFSLAAQCTEYDVEDVFTAYAYAAKVAMNSKIRKLAAIDPKGLVRG